MEYIIESANKRKYKCPYCNKRLYRDRLPSHVEKHHSELIPEGYTSSRVVFNSINHKEKGTCVVCGKESPWNDDKCRYDRICTNPECRKKYKEMVENRIKKTHNGKTSRDLLLDPDHQNKMLKGRRISGTYTWSDGTKKDYVGNYEKKALEFFDTIFNCKSEDVITPGPIIKYIYEGVEHFWITDIYYEPYNLAIDCKDGGDNPNNRDMPIYRAKQQAKEDAIIKQGQYNYLRLTNNNFEQLFTIMAELKMQLVENNRSERIVRINENTAMAGICPMVGTFPVKKDGTFVINYMKDEKRDIATSKDFTLTSIFTQDENGIVRKLGKEFLEDCRYNIYYLENEGVDERLLEIAKNIDTIKSPNYIYETLFGKKMYTIDQILCEDMTEVMDRNQYLYFMTKAVEEITEATIRKSRYSIPSANIMEEGIVEYKDENGYYIENDRTHIRTKSRDRSNYTNIEKAIIMRGVI